MLDFITAAYGHCRESLAITRLMVLFFGDMRIPSANDAPTGPASRGAAQVTALLSDSLSRDTSGHKAIVLELLHLL